MIDLMKMKENWQSNHLLWVSKLRQPSASGVKSDVVTDS